MKEVLHKSGRSFPVKFGFAALADLCDLEKVTLSDLNKLGSNMSLRTAFNLIYVGLKHGARKAGQDFELTIDDIPDLLDDDREFLTNVMGVFTDSLVPKDSTAEGEEKKIPANQE